MAFKSKWNCKHFIASRKVGANGNTELSSILLNYIHAKMPIVPRRLWARGVSVRALCKRATGLDYSSVPISTEPRTCKKSLPVALSYPCIGFSGHPSLSFALGVAFSKCLVFCAADAYPGKQLNPYGDLSVQTMEQTPSNQTALTWNLYPLDLLLIWKTTLCQQRQTGEMADSLCPFETVGRDLKPF